MGAFESSLTDVPLQEFSPILGAEAKIELIDWYGRPAIRKYRIPKPYRIEQIDSVLRWMRTKEEVQILQASKLAGVDCPVVLFADPNRSEIIMEYVAGTLVKDVREDGNGIFRRIGRYTGTLHSKGIIHGDLTTKNMIIWKERLVFIDFGLSFFSERIEDRAEDLHLLKQALKSSEPLKVALASFSSALKGYEEILGKKAATAVRNQMAMIELRGRYAQVD